MTNTISPAAIVVLPDGVTGIRALPARTGQVFTTGRGPAGRFATLWDAVVLRITPRGHWYRSDDPKDTLNDIVCRGCGRTGHLDTMLDYRPCAAPAGSGDVVNALRPARVVGSVGERPQARRDRAAHLVGA